MQPIEYFENPDLLGVRLEQILNWNHPLFKLAKEIDWSYLEKQFGTTYVEDRGRPGCSTLTGRGCRYSFLTGVIVSTRVMSWW